MSLERRCFKHNRVPVGRPGIDVVLRVALCAAAKPRCSLVAQRRFASSRLTTTGPTQWRAAELTAWQALSDRARVQPGERVFIQGGAGGVGSLAVQLAKALGAEVTATASEDDEPLVKTLGADGVVPSVSAALPPGEPLFDVLLNTFPGPVPVESYGLVRPGGRLVTLAQPPDPSMAARHGIQGIFFVVTPDPDELRLIADLAEQGELRPVIARTLPLADASMAYGSPPAPRRPGKTVLAVRT
jgi:NADPH:quinone reductase-like Zn-dependent oxidoreductase